MLLKDYATQRFSVLKQSNKAEMITKYDSRVASLQQYLNAMIEIDREGKTPGSVLCGLVYAPGCSLLVIFRIYDAKKNSGGRIGYPENYWNPFFVSPKYGKRSG
jgi:hypothetical protein